MVSAQSYKLQLQPSVKQQLKMQVDRLQTENSTGVRLQQEATFQKKKVGLAVLYSLLLPGLGEAYVGETGYTKFFLASEALGWGLLIANRLNFEWRTKDYKTYAVQHAGVNAAGKDEQYWINIGKHDSIYEYNEQRRRDRNVNAIYNEDAANFWRWDSRSSRLGYDWRRIRAREIEQQEIYFVGGIVLNHIVSAINALRLARAYNKRQELSWNLNMNVDAQRNTLTLGLQKSF